MAAVVAAGWGAWWAMQPPSGPPVEQTLPMVESVAIADATTTTVRPAPLVVHVAGAVRDQGVHEIRPGGRVIDAIEAAGGLTADADGTRLNLALLVADQQRIWVPRVGEEEPPVVLPEGGGGHSTAGAGASGGLIDINHADAASLEALTGIGPSLAAAIVDHRDREGAFATLDDLLGVPGIGPAKLEQLRDEATV